MLVATTRKRADPAEMFGARGPALSFANIIVSIPPSNARQIGEVQWPRQVPGDAATEFVTLKADVIERPKALAWFHRTLRAVPKRQVLVFIHGFNNRFDDAVFRFAQIVHDSDAPVVPILFTWPSRAACWPMATTGEYRLFPHALESMLPIARDPAVGEISILAHSMGNLLASKPCARWPFATDAVTPKIRNVLLAAPGCRCRSREGGDRRHGAEGQPAGIHLVRLAGRPGAGRLPARVGQRSPPGSHRSRSGALPDAARTSERDGPRPHQAQGG